jgi:hypothetical protein
MKANHRKYGMKAIAAAGACLMLLAAAFSQNAEAQTAQAPHRMAGFGRGGFIGAELLSPGKVVTGAPYSAQVVVEHIQTLADGNTIHTTTTVNVCRDSQGRTRRALTVGAIGPLAGQGTPQKLIFISDPVSGTRYVLNPDTLEARQMQFRAHERSGLAVGKARQRPANPNIQTESLGTQVIEALPAQGTRITRTIPAGQIGNQQAIVIVTERWYSPDLQTDLLRREINPQFGQTTSQLTNVVRAEPDASLFQVPPDYTIKKGRPLGSN